MYSPSSGRESRLPLAKASGTPSRAKSAVKISIEGKTSKPQRQIFEKKAVLAGSAHSQTLQRSASPPAARAGWLAAVASGPARLPLALPACR